MSLAAGILALALVWWFLRSFPRANPARLAVMVRRGGGVLALGLAALLLVRGRIDMAVLVGGGAGWLLGWDLAGVPGFGWVARFGQPAVTSPGSVSRVRSATVEMELDHDSGRMSGTVLAGRFAGTSLDALGPADLNELRRFCHADDPDGFRLLEAYLDRRFPGRGEDAERDGDARPPPDPQQGAMTEQEAYEVLGLQPGADADRIRRTHRDLMKKLHPDQGGSTYLASRVNQAKDVLLNRHR